MCVFFTINRSTVFLPVDRLRPRWRQVETNEPTDGANRRVDSPDKPVRARETRISQSEPGSAFKLR